MSFTTEEIDGVIEKIVRTSIRREYSALGTRRTDLTFSDVQDAAAGVFVLKPNAPFYVVFLSSQQLKELIDSEREILEDFLDTVNAVGRRVQPVSKISPLANARVALEALTAASGTRTSAFQDITQIPAFQRFDDNTQKFLSESGKNIRSNGELVRTPDDARSRLDSLYVSLKASHEDLVRRAGLLEVAFSDYESMDLPGTLSASVISNATDLLQSRYEELAAMGDKERLVILREAVLDVLAARATVGGFGSLSPPTIFVVLEGSGSVYASSSKTATPAYVDADLGPYSILEEENELDITVEGDSILVALPGSYIATLEATVAGPYALDEAPTPPVERNDLLRIYLENYPSVGVTTDIDLDLGSTGSVEVWDMAVAINGQITTATPLIAEPYANPSRYVGNVDLTDIGGGDYELETVAPLSVDFGALGIEQDDLIIVTDPTSSNKGAIYKVKTTPIAGDTVLVCTLSFHPGTHVDEADKTIDVGTDALPIRLRITGQNDSPKPDYRLTALDNKTGITIPELNQNDNDQEQFYAATTLGFVPLMTATSRKTTASELADVIVAAASGAINGVARIDAEEVFEASEYSGAGRTDPNDFLKVIASKLYTRGDVTSGTSVTFTTTEEIPSTVVNGDIVVLRSSATLGDVNKQGVVTSVGTNSVDVTMASSITADTNIEWEIGPALGSFPFDCTAVVSGGTPNDGTYNVLSQGDIPFELGIDAALPLPYKNGALPREFTLEVGLYRLRLSSSDETIQTAITVDDGGGNPESCAYRLFSTLPASGVGSTKYFQVPETPADLEEEDVLELYTTQYNQPSTEVAIVSVDSSDSTIELAEELPTDTPAFVFSQTSQVPFARVRNKRRNNYDTFKDSLTEWADLAANQSSYFKELSRLLNALKVNTNPTVDQLGSVTNHLELLEPALDDLEAAIGSYSADVVDEVDTLISSYQQEGADRAVDILLEGRFSDFFGLDEDEVSYAGTVQKGMKEVNREDLPVRRDNRTQREFAAEEAMLAEYDEVDYEFDQSDIDDVEEPNIPAYTADLDGKVPF